MTFPRGSHRNSATLSYITSPSVYHCGPHDEREDARPTSWTHHKDCHSNVRSTRRNWLQHPSEMSTSVYGSNSPSTHLQSFVKYDTGPGNFFGILMVQDMSVIIKHSCNKIFSRKNIMRENFSFLPKMKSFSIDLLSLKRYFLTLKMGLI